MAVLDQSHDLDRRPAGVRGSDEGSRGVHAACLRAVWSGPKEPVFASESRTSTVNNQWKEAPLSTGMPHPAERFHPVRAGPTQGECRARCPRHRVAVSWTEDV